MPTPGQAIFALQGDLVLVSSSLVGRTARVWVHIPVTDAGHLATDAACAACFTFPTPTGAAVRWHTGGLLRLYVHAHGTLVLLQINGHDTCLVREKRRAQGLPANVMCLCVCVGDSCGGVEEAP